MRLTDGQWSNSKPSVFYTSRADGFMDCWDVLQQQLKPILSIKVPKDSKLDKQIKRMHYAIYYFRNLLLRCLTIG